MEKTISLVKYKCAAYLEYNCLVVQDMILK